VDNEVNRELKRKAQFYNLERFDAYLLEEYADPPAWWKPGDETKAAVKGDTYRHNLTGPLCDNCSGYENLPSFKIARARLASVSATVLPSRHFLSCVAGEDEVRRQRRARAQR
jgi:hypothetical protein